MRPGRAGRPFQTAAHNSPAMDVMDERTDAASEQPHGVSVRRADVLCLGPLIVLTIYSLAMIPVAPSLLGPHPLLLSAIHGSESSMLAAGAAARAGTVPLWAVCV